MSHATDMAYRTAFHEAGHAVMAMALSVRVVELVAESDEKGHMIPDQQMHVMLTPAEKCLIAAAGAAAELLWQAFERPNARLAGDGHWKDHAAVADDLEALGHRALFYKYVELVACYLVERWQQVSALAGMLLQTGQASMDQINRVAREVSPMSAADIAEVPRMVEKIAAYHGQ